MGLLLVTEHRSYLVTTWCSAADEGVLSAYRLLVFSSLTRDQPFPGRGTAVTRTWLDGGRPPGKLHRPSRADDVDTANRHAFKLTLRLLL